MNPNSHLIAGSLVAVRALWHSKNRLSLHAMNFLAKALTLSTAIFACSLATPANALTFEQMEEGAAILATIHPETQLTATQTESVLALRNYSEGFFAVTFNAFFLSPDTNPQPLYKPSAWMTDPKRCGTSLLDFITRHKPRKIDLGQVVSPSAVFTAWYLYNCENSDVGAKLNVVFLLNKAFGPDYLGVDELKKAMEADARQNRAAPLDEKK